MSLFDKKSKESEKREARLAQRYAHRGFHSKPEIPENSLPAFRRAIEYGFGSELDVHLIADGSLVIFHDEKLERQTGAKGEIEDYDITNLKKLRLGFPCYLIGGESEFIIGPLVESIAGENEAYLSVPGIIRYDGSGFRYTGFGKWNDDLDSIPYPARGKMNNRLYVRPDSGEMMATVYVSRGCPSRCVFCLTPVISGQTVRFRSVENVMGEIRECYFKYGIRNFFFRADTFTINREWASDLCDAIIFSELYQKIEFTVNARADTVSEQLLEKLKKAGCFMLAVGFESGSDESLKLMRKGTSVAENIRAADLAKKTGLPLFGFFIIGFPWENMNHINDTLSHIMRIDPDFIELHVAMPFFGTELYSMCEKAGTLDNDSWGFDYFNPNTKGSSYIPLDELKKIRKKFLIRFYTRPSYLKKKLSECIKNHIHSYRRNCL